jgi:tetratricopeptide (TPR) repeat protein
MRAVTAAVLRATDPTPNGTQQADAEADRAIEWLNKALAAGYNIERLANARDLDTLRARDDFPRSPADELKLRADELVSRSEWAGAAEQYARLIEVQPDTAGHYYRLAIVWLGAENTEEYRAVCQRMFERFQKTENQWDAERVLYTCVPAPEAAQDPQELVRLARLGATAYKGNERVLGAALFRAGQFQEAAEQFAISQQTHPSRTWDLCFLAMIQHRLGETDKAKQLFDQAVKWQQENAVPWTEKIESDALLREARELLASEPPAKE